jgi:hypothetical protein
VEVRHGLLLLQGLNFALCLFRRIANFAQGTGWQRRGGTAFFGITTACQRGLGNSFGLVGTLVRLGVDQDHFERRVLKHAIKAFRVYETHRQQSRVHKNGHAQSNRQSTKVLQELHRA